MPYLNFCLPWNGSGFIHLILVLLLLWCRKCQCTLMVIDFVKIHSLNFFPLKVCLKKHSSWELSELMLCWGMRKHGFRRPCTVVRKMVLACSRRSAVLRRQAGGTSSTMPVHLWILWTPYIPKLKDDSLLNELLNTAKHSECCALDIHHSFPRDEFVKWKDRWAEFLWRPCAFSE